MSQESVEVGGHGAGPEDDIQTVAKDAVDEVLARIEEVIRFLRCRPSADIETSVGPKYMDGFVAALQRRKDFWSRFSVKVLRMAGHAASLAAYFAARDVQSGAADVIPVVEAKHLLMAMAAIRTVCTAGVPERGSIQKDGLPCNRVNFKIDADTKAALAGVFGSITEDLAGPN